MKIQSDDPMDMGNPILYLRVIMIELAWIMSGTVIFLISGLMIRMMVLTGYFLERRE